MAECEGGVCNSDSTPWYSGGQGGWGGTGKPESYWIEQADLVRNPDMDRETRTLAMSHQLAQLGSSRYMSLYPEAFERMGPTYSMTPLWKWFAMKTQALRNMKSQFYGPESTWIRWLIDTKLKDMADKAGRASIGNFLVSEPEIPNWAEEYLTPTTAPVAPQRDKRAKGVQAPREVYGVRPLGPQANLSPDQQRWLAGYGAYAQAGYPTKYIPGAIEEMADIDRWWSPFMTESGAMFPKTPTKPKWAAATQGR